MNDIEICEKTEELRRTVAEGKHWLSEFMTRGEHDAYEHGKLFSLHNSISLASIDELARCAAVFVTATPNVLPIDDSPNALPSLADVAEKFEEASGILNELSAVPHLRYQLAPLILRARVEVCAARRGIELLQSQVQV